MIIMVIIIGIIALILLLTNLSFTLTIASFLKSKGIKINYPLLHVKAFEYARLYKTFEGEQGMSPGIYMGFIVSSALFFIVLVVGIYTSTLH